MVVRPPRMCKSRRPGMGGGFTLIELIAVLVVLAILAGAAVPTVASMGTRRSGMAARQVQRDLTFARQRAIATGVRSWVTFNTSAESWSVLVESTASPGRAGATVLTDVATGKPFTQVLNGTEFAGAGLVSASFNGAAEVGFDWLGQPLNSSQNPLSANGTVALTNSYSVTVAAGTGFVDLIAP